MEATEQNISIFDDKGNKLLAKPKSMLNRERDIFRMVLVIVTNNTKGIWIAKIPENKGFLWGGRYGTSAAAVVREKEKPAAAAVRALKQGLGLTFEKPTLLATQEQLYTAGAVKRFVTCFVFNTAEDIQTTPEQQGMWVKQRQLVEMLQKEQEKFSPLFILAWKGVKSQI